MSGERPRILFLAHLLPWPLEGGGQIKSYHTLRILSSKYEVKMIAFIRSEKEKASIEPLKPLCKGGIDTILLPRSKVRDGMKALEALVRRKSFLIARDDSPAMRRCLLKLLTQPDGINVVHVDHLQMMQFIPPPDRIPSVKVVLDNHNVEHRIVKRIAEGGLVSPPPPTPPPAGGGRGALGRMEATLLHLLPSPRRRGEGLGVGGLQGGLLNRLYAQQEWPKLRDFERDAVRRADLTLAVSEEDATGLRELAASQADRIVAVPIGVDTEYFAPVPRKPASQNLLFIGTLYWPPNVDALLYFCRQIWPRVKAKIPDVTLTIVGAKPTAAISTLPKNDGAIRVFGSVPDVRPYAEDCSAFIVPLLSGSGMRVKILNALSMGLPVVSTRVGAEGIAVTDGTDILLADTPEEFAEAIIRLLKDPELGGRLGKAGRRLMETQYSWEVVGRQLLSAYETRVFARPHPPTPSPNAGRGGDNSPGSHARPESVLPLSQHWERGLGGEGGQRGDSS